MKKNHFLTILLSTFLSSTLIISGALGGTLLDAAKKLSWDTLNIRAIEELFSNKSSVESFLKEIDPDLAEIETSVGEYEITDLLNNGRLEMVVTADFTGRAIYNTVYIIQKINNKFKISDIPAPGINVLDLKSRIVDLNDDGIKEILVPRLLKSPRFETDPHPTIDDVYEWDGNRFRKADACFKKYYRTLLLRLKAEHEAIIQGKKLDVPSQKDLLIEKYEKEIEEVNRILSE